MTISPQHLNQAINKHSSLTMKEKEAIMDQIYKQQPNLLGSILVQQQMGNTLEQMDVLLNILIVCWLAVKESGKKLSLITEDDQDRNLNRYVAQVNFIDDLGSSTNKALQQYIDDHSEEFLFAYVHKQVTDAGFHVLQEEHSKYLTMAAMNLVNCIAEKLEQSLI